MKLFSYNELDMDARSHACSVGWDEIHAIADKEGVEAANKMLDSWKFLEDGTRVDGVEKDGIFHTYLYGHDKEIEVVIQTEPQIASEYPLPKDFTTIINVCGPKQRETIESCPGCDTPLDELENGGVEHSCECGHELTAKECEEQNGMCERCNWLMS